MGRIIFFMGSAYPPLRGSINIRNYHCSDSLERYMKKKARTKKLCQRGFVCNYRNNKGKHEFYFDIRNENQISLILGIFERILHENDNEHYPTKNKVIVFYPFFLEISITQDKQEPPNCHLCKYRVVQRTIGNSLIDTTSESINDDFFSINTIYGTYLKITIYPIKRRKNILRRTFPDLYPPEVSNDTPFFFDHIEVLIMSKNLHEHIKFESILRFVKEKQQNLLNIFRGRLEDLSTRKSKIFLNHQRETEEKLFE